MPKNGIFSLTGERSLTLPGMAQSIGEVLGTGIEEAS